MPDIDNPYKEPRKESPGEKDQRLAAQLADLILAFIKWLKRKFRVVI